MTMARRLELSGGVATALLGIAVAVEMFRMEQATSLRTNTEFHSTRTFLLAAALFILPSLFVGIGAYMHTVRRRSGGWTSLVIGAVSSIIIFLLFFSVGAFSGKNLWSRLSVLLALSTVATLLLAFTARRDE